MAEPPLDAGGSHETEAARSQSPVAGKEATTLSGREGGTVPTVKMVDAGDARLDPVPLDTTTLQV